jgi:hypothetical protein
VAGGAEKEELVKGLVKTEVGKLESVQNWAAQGADSLPESGGRLGLGRVQREEKVAREEKEPEAGRVREVRMRKSEEEGRGTKARASEVAARMVQLEARQNKAKRLKEDALLEAARKAERLSLNKERELEKEREKARWTGRELEQREEARRRLMIDMNGGGESERTEEPMGDGKENSTRADGTIQSDGRKEGSQGGGRADEVGMKKEGGAKMPQSIPRRAMGEQGRQALLNALVQDDAEGMVKALTGEVAEGNFTASEGARTMLRACKQDAANCCARLLTLGVDPNRGEATMLEQGTRRQEVGEETVRDGQTPMQAAIMHGSERCVTALLHSTKLRT